MPKWLQLLVAGCAVVIAASVGFLALSGPLERRGDRTERAVAEAITVLTRVGIGASIHYDRGYKYGSLSEVAQSMAVGADKYDTSILVLPASIHPSPDGHAYLALVDFSDKAGVECVSTEESRVAPTPEDPSRRIPPRIHGWDPSSVGVLECRRTTWPWSWLRWTGLSAVNERTIARAYDRARRQ